MSSRQILQHTFVQLYLQNPEQVGSFCIWIAFEFFSQPKPVSCHLHPLSRPDEFSDSVPVFPIKCESCQEFLVFFITPGYFLYDWLFKDLKKFFCFFKLGILFVFQIQTEATLVNLFVGFRTDELFYLVQVFAKKSQAFQEITFLLFTPTYHHFLRLLKSLKVLLSFLGCWILSELRCLFHAVASDALFCLRANML